MIAYRTRLRALSEGAKEHLSNGEKNKKFHELVSALQETLNPDERRGFIDSFLLRKQRDEMSPNHEHKTRPRSEGEKVIGGHQAVVEDRKNIVPMSLPHTANYDIQRLLHQKVGEPQHLQPRTLNDFKEAANEPPGPKPVPLLGNLLQLDLDRPHESLCELAKTYGSVFKVYFGPKKVVVLAGYKTVKQALVNYAEEFGEREIARTFKNFSEEHGILFSNGENWKEMRRFALTNLRDFGMGKRGSEEKIIEEIQYLKEVFESFGGEPFDTTQPVNYAVSNIISSIVYGSRFEYSDPRFKKMVERANENVRIGGSAPIRLYNVFPWIGPFLRSKRTLETNAANNKKQINELVSALKETLNPDDCRGYVDSFLLRKQRDEQSGQKNSRFNEKNLFTTVINLFVAGTDTTGTTLRWGLLLMAKYPHIQNRVHEEIDRVIGGRQAVVEDRKNLPYTDAVIHEIQRLANIVPMSLPHTTSCDVQFNGFFIEKGTTVYPLLTSVLRDENEWESPHAFNPAHFLDEKGRFVKKDAFLPFSAGRRVCLGESLARMELFLFFTSLLQHFCFSPPPGVSKDQLDLMGVGTIIIPNLSSVLSEEGPWKFPHEFNPANVLNEQGQFEKPEAFIPFSARLASMELFLILVTLLRQFQFFWPEDAGEPDFTPVYGITLTPKPYRMGVRLRQRATT
ncbi:hypothetical protein MHYP_G00148180 [Metynnis hypsauchen]